MVQIGNLHIGIAQTAKADSISAGEAFILWDNLISRYDIIMATNLYINHVHDPEFALILRQGLDGVLQKQVAELEKLMKKYQLPLPRRNPKSVQFRENTSLINDQYIFNRLFTGIQNFVSNHIRSVRIVVYNKDLRKFNIRNLKTELKLYNALCKYGKLKGWIAVPPLHTVE